MVAERPPQAFGAAASDPRPDAKSPAAAPGSVPGLRPENAPNLLPASPADPQRGAPTDPQQAASAPPDHETPPSAGRTVPHGFANEPALAPAPGALVRKAAHGDPLMRRLGGGLLRAVGASAASAAQEEAEIGARLARPVSVCRQIAVLSIRGGAGKTTLSALIAATIAEHRTDRVLALDADPALGSLPLRLGAQAQYSIHDLAAAQPRSWEDAAGYLTPIPQRLWVLSGSTGGRLTGELEPNVLWPAFGPISRYFSVTVVDCGAGIFGAVQRSVLQSAHAQVLVTPGTVDGALSAKGALDWYTANGLGTLLSRTVIALVSHTPHADADLSRVRAMLSGSGLPVFHIPYDRHLATGAAIEPGRVGVAVRLEATRVAAEVFARSIGSDGR